MKTFILKWNPAISNFKIEDFEMILTGEYWGLNWSIWDYKEVEIGDRYYMVRVGDNPTGDGHTCEDPSGATPNDHNPNGIVLAGNIISKPYICEDWSGKGRIVYYADLSIDEITDNGLPFVTTETLTAKFPGFDWTKGHSGLLLPDSIADPLNAYWDNEVMRYGF